MLKNYFAMETAIMIITFIFTYALVALVLYVVARIIFPTVDDFRDAKQFKARRLQNQNSIGIKLN